MSEKELMVAPKRLLDGDDEIGRALRQRQEHWEAVQRHVQPNRAQFAALTAKRDRRDLVAQRSLLASAAAGAILGLTSYFHWQAQWEDDQQLVAAPDRMLVAPAVQHAAEQAKHQDSLLAAQGPETAGSESVIGVAALGAVPTSGVPISVGLSARAQATAQGRAPTGLHSVGVKPAEATRPMSSPPSGSPGADQPLRAATPSGPAHKVTQDRPGQAFSHRECHRLAYADARACYTQISQGSGVTAELAYLERARLEQNQGGDSSAALHSLDEYQRRFPRGTLQPEATLARIRLLVSTHHNREARAAIAQALPKMPEKAAVLREVAVDLAVAAGDCAQASQLLKQIPAELANPAWKAAHLGRCAAMVP